MDKRLSFIDRNRAGSKYMPNYTVQLRRGTATEHGSFTGAAGEVTVNTTRNSVHVHDGSTAGGTEMATKSSVDNLSSDTITDADSDTHVKVEASSDSDTIAFTAGGTNIVNMTASTVTVAGDLTVTGTSTAMQTETVTIDDNIIVLNNNATGSASADAGIEVERGDDANKTLIWNETSDKWTVGSETFVAGTFEGTATSAKYADLAERYHAGAPIEAGSVVCFGGENEIEMCNEEGCTRAAGVVSTAPAYMMNRDAGDDSTHPYVALAGRVPCKVTGSIKKGDLLMTSAMAGHAMAGEVKGGAMIGKALEDFVGGSGGIEGLVKLM